MHYPLSKNFTLNEFTHSNIAMRSSIDNTPSKDQIKNIKRLCAWIVQPLRDHINAPIHISSGFRCKKLNTLIKGAKNSQHMGGLAADITCEFHNPEQLAQMIQDLQLPFDQLIIEFGRWVHVSIAQNPEDTRSEVLIASKKGKRTVYTRINTHEK